MHIHIMYMAPKGLNYCKPNVIHAGGVNLLISSGAEGHEIQSGLDQWYIVGRCGLCTPGL